MLLNHAKRLSKGASDAIRLRIWVKAFSMLHCTCRSPPCSGRCASCSTRGSSTGGCIWDMCTWRSSSGICMKSTQNHNVHSKYHVVNIHESPCTFM